ncbi:MAG: GNAT family N-acetyltransferase [Candidatus Thorarchaeota archaeon]|nr:MAG: GNAT family N-acetyltransferase [Candidatus Thorarchaeota archaeon]
MRIEILTRSHNRQGFDCGNADLNRYLRDTARQHSEKGISRTFVLVDEENSSEILGFFTLASREILVEKLPEKYAKKYPSRAPAVKLGRLAVAKHMQKRGLGTHMMINAMDRVLKVCEHLGLIGFFVDAKNDEAVLFYHQFGFIPLPDNPLELFLPLATIRQAFRIG